MKAVEQAARKLIDERNEMRTTLWLVPASVVLFFGCGAPPPPPFKPVADVKQLMQSVIDPAADVVWDSVGTIISSAGTEERAPQNDEEWTAVRNSALMLTESGNLLMMVPRAKDGDVWMKMSLALVDTGAAALKAAEAKNKDAIFTVGGQIYDACSGCHQRYMDAIVQASPK